MALRLLDAPLDDGKWTTQVFAGDAAVFPTSSPHGFAHQAWRRLPANESAAPLPEPPPAFLEFAANRPGADPNPAGLESRRTSFQIAVPPDPPPDSAPAFPAAEASRPESFFRIEGALAGRRLAAPVELPSWTNVFLVTNSAVQFAVNRAGQVISTVLLAGSGLKEADESALAAVNVLRFRPAGMSAPEYVWDTATFYWKTIEPPPQNGE
jgi:TonB family protein